MEYMNKTITIEELKKLCIQYDMENGHYPETEFEGQSIFEYVINSLVDDKKYVNVVPIYEEKNYDIIKMDYKIEEF